MELVDALAYKGFDPLNLRKLLQKLNPNVIQLNLDLNFLITLVLSRGSNVFKKISKLSPEVQERLNRLVDKYHIERSQSSTMTINTVTLSRILKSFPDHAFTILKDRPDLRRPVSVEMMTVLGYTGFPSCLRGEFVFSLVPLKTSEKNYAGLIKAVIHYLFEESKTLNSRPNEYASNDTKALDRIIHYAYIAWSKSFISLEKKNHYMTKASLSQTVMDSWSDAFDKSFPAYKDVGVRFGQ